jgi:hypothetical protein
MHPRLHGGAFPNPSLRLLYRPSDYARGKGMEGGGAALTSHKVLRGSAVAAFLHALLHLVGVILIFILFLLL